MHECLIRTISTPLISGSAKPVELLSSFSDCGDDVSKEQQIDIAVSPKSQ